jgi:hypothetical protein
MHTDLAADPGALRELRRVLKPGGRMFGCGALSGDWTIPQAIGAAGFSDVTAVLYWSRMYGHCGQECGYLVATK